MSMYETFYPKRLWIDYPQDTVEGQRYKYVCRSCRLPTEHIQGVLENHLLDCLYRQKYTYIQIED